MRAALPKDSARTCIISAKPRCLSVPGERMLVHCTPAMRHAVCEVSTGATHHATLTILWSVPNLIEKQVLGDSRTHPKICS